MVKVTSDSIILSTTLTQKKKLGIAGSIGIWVGSSPPDGALLCNGAEYNTADYLDLSASLGRSSFLKFNVPNLSGELPLGTNATTNPDLRAEGGDLTIQGIGHTHMGNNSRFGSVSNSWNIEIGETSPQIWAEEFAPQQSENTTSLKNTEVPQINYLPPYLAVNFIIYT